MGNTHRETTSRYPILIADDSHLLRSMLEASLKSAGYEVVAARNGKEALEIFRNGYFPVVITDWIMPEMDGLELCRAIRNKDSGRYTFIILLTSQDSKNDIIAGLDAGADEYLIKPIHQVELVTRLKTAKRILDLESSLNASMEVIKRLSLIDPSTGIYNQNYMDERILYEIKRAYRYGHSLALIMVAIDQLGQIEADYGRPAKDSVLNSCARCLAESVRKDVDWLARFGEEKFVVVLPETDASGALILAKRLRIRIASIVVGNQCPEVKLTASVGLVGFTASNKAAGMTAQTLLDKADSCLAKAREAGNESINGIQLLG